MIIKALDQYLAVVYGNQLETWAQDGGKTLQEFGTATEELTYGNQVRRGPVKAFGNGGKRTSRKTTVTSGKREKCQRGPQQTLG